MGSQGTVLAASLFEVLLRKKEVTELEAPAGLVYDVTKRKCSPACHGEPVSSVSVCNLESG